MVLLSKLDLEALEAVRLCREFAAGIKLLDDSVEHVAFLIGVVVGGEAVVHRVVWGCNVAAEKDAKFVADPQSTSKAVVLAEARGELIVAVFHSHPSCRAVPSELDRKGALYWPTVWVISGVDGIRAWVPYMEFSGNVAFREIKVVVDEELGCYECLPPSCKPACSNEDHHGLNDHEYRG